MQSVVTTFAKSEMPKRTSSSTEGGAVALAIDFGGTKVDAALVASDGTIVAESRHALPTGRALSRDQIERNIQTVAGEAIRHVGTRHLLGAAFVSERSAGHISVADIAAHVQINPHYAMSIFRRAVGISIRDCLAQRRVAAAKRLLLTTDRSVREVGFAAGFQSQSQFYDRFARWCDASPGSYRMRMAAAYGRGQSDSGLNRSREGDEIAAPAS